MTDSRSFGTQSPRVPHLAQLGTGGLSGEVADLRGDVETAFQSIEQEVDAVTSNVRQLIHFINEGPAEGFASGSYKTVTGGAFPTAVTWYDKPGLGRVKIVEKLLTWTGVNPATITWNMYDAAGAVLVTVTDTISYTNGFETSRLRAIS